MSATLKKKIPNEIAAKMPARHAGLAGLARP
jgi:hypothetical protein